ncbi:MAG: O-antigen/teichoic acid export membrane protein [Phenylobacterium sp.]|jgi:O-antigen/teichoic acid export membrane protein
MKKPFTMPFTLHQSVYFALGIVIMKSVSLLMLPIVTRYLSPTQFGHLELLLSISDFATILTGFALVDVLYRFAGVSTNEEEEKKIGATTFSLALIICAVSLVLGMILAPIGLPYLGEGIALFDLQLVALIISVEACLLVPLAWMKMRNNAFSFFILTTGKAICQAVVIWQSLVMGLGITAILIGSLVSSVLLVAVLARIQWRETGFSLDTKRLPDMFLYCIPLVISGVATYAIVSGDRWAIAMVSTAEELGLYALGKKLALVSVLLMQPFILWWLPRRIKQLQEDNGRDSVAHTTSLGIALIIGFATMICIGSPIMIDLFIDHRYTTAMDYVPAVALLYAVKQIAELANLGCYIGKTTWSVMSIDLGTAAISIICLVLLSKPFGVAGVLGALLIAQCTRLVFFYVLSQRVLYLNYAKGHLFVFGLLGCGLTFMSLQIETVLHHFIMVVFATLILVGYLHFSGLLSLNRLLKKQNAASTLNPDGV